MRALFLWFVALTLVSISILLWQKVAGPSRKSNNFSVLVLTLDGYRRYWKGFFTTWGKYFPKDIPIYFANEKREIDVPTHGLNVKQIKTGPGKYGKRLLTALEQVPSEYILFCQEDMFLEKRVTKDYLRRSLQQVRENNLLNLKLFKDCRHTVDLPEDLHNPLWYILSHHPSLWRKTFLRDITDDWYVFRHEVEICRLAHSSPEISSRIGCAAESFPYIDVSRRGQLTPEGRALYKKEGMLYIVEPDELMNRPCRW